jgi:hypothetical protein
MRTFQLLVVLLLILLLGAVAGAVNYSCRDSQGQLHFADSLTNLPEDCRDRAQMLNSEPVDNLNFVPPPAESSGSDIRFEHSVREMERELQQKQQLGKQLQLRADKLAAKYAAASRDKHRARRNWKYSSRETIKAADESIRQVLEGKQQLLQELSAAALSSQDAQQIRATLDQIGEE